MPVTMFAVVPSSGSKKPMPVGLLAASGWFGSKSPKVVKAAVLPVFVRASRLSGARPPPVLGSSEVNSKLVGVERAARVTLDTDRGQHFDRILAKGRLAGAHRPGRPARCRTAAYGAGLYDRRNPAWRPSGNRCEPWSVRQPAQPAQRDPGVASALRGARGMGQNGYRAAVKSRPVDCTRHRCRG